MKAFQRFWSIFCARNLEFLRDRSALAWNFVFPFFLLIGFSFIFDSGSDQVLYKVGVIGKEAAVWQEKIDALPYIQALVLDDAAEAEDKLLHHKLDLLFNTTPHPPVYQVSETSPKGYQAERMVIRELAYQQRGPPEETFQRRSVVGIEVPYLEWFFPGLLGMNIMFSAVFGVGYVIVRYRKNGVLKRLSATPLTAFEFLCAQLASRLFLVLGTTVVIFGGSLLLFDFSVRGDYGALMLIFVLGSASLVAMGLLVAARTESEELAGGLLNMMTWPMMFLSEVWFSLEGSPVWVQKLALAFPLTHMVQGSRAIMNDGAGFNQISGHLLAMGLMTLVFLALGAYFFRWTRR